MSHPIHSHFPSLISIHSLPPFSTPASDKNSINQSIRPSRHRLQGWWQIHCRTLTQCFSICYMGHMLIVYGHVELCYIALHSLVMLSGTSQCYYCSSLCDAVPIKPWGQIQNDNTHYTHKLEATESQRVTQRTRKGRANVKTRTKTEEQTEIMTMLSSNFRQNVINVRLSGILTDRPTPFTLCCIDRQTSAGRNLKFSLAVIPHYIGDDGVSETKIKIIGTVRCFLSLMLFLFHSLLMLRPYAMRLT